jgi:capsular polysaccharide biosynthesis protein
MKLADYLLVLRRRWWVILLTALAGAVGAYGFSKVQTPLFRSEAEYLVVPSRYDNGLSMVLQGSMNSFSDMARAPVQLEKISNDLRLDRSPDWMLKHVAIQARPDERKMIVQVDYPEDPAMAQRLAQAVGDNMVALVGSLNDSIDGTDRINMRVMQPARPAYLYRPQTRLNVAAGFILGLILGIILAFVLEALDDSLKTPADIERYVGLTTLGAIPTVEPTRAPRTAPRAAPQQAQP